MTAEEQLRLQAFLDGELPEKEARAMASWMARDEEAAALFRELRNTRAALAGAESGIKVPASREFYWSRIEREIQRIEPSPAAAPAPGLWLRTWLRPLLIPAGALASLVLIGIAVSHLDFLRPPIRAETELASADSDTFTYHDDSSGTTLVWLNYPAER